MAGRNTVTADPSARKADVGCATRYSEEAEPDETQEHASLMPIELGAARHVGLEESGGHFIVEQRDVAPLSREKGWLQVNAT
jgi:hypothetical protein